ncbi:MAG: hypothetical protein LBB65_04270 [Burkholderiales bacterium]|jgi:hypothetical protein|nr:hypothetical protein [Burkholderiales bacterium]
MICLLCKRLAEFRASRRARKRALVRAEELGRRLRPGEPIMGVWLCAKEDTRYVVRVFCGKRYEPVARMGPPWRECLIIAVNKNDETAAELIEGAEPYSPIIR